MSTMYFIYQQNPKYNFNCSHDSILSHENFALSQWVNKILQMTLHRSIAWTLLVGQILGLMPVCGIFSYNEESLKFTWKSWRFCYTIIILIGSILYVLLIFMFMITDGVSLNATIASTAYLSNLFNVILFFKLGLKWSELIKFWRCMELNFPSFMIRKNLLKLKMNSILAVIIGASLGKWEKLQFS